MTEKSEERITRARIRPGAWFGQDFGQHRWPDVQYGDIDTIFEIKYGHPSGQVVCWAPSFGCKPYGSGALYVKPEDLLPVEKERMAVSRKRIDIKEFRERGYLQEVNRLFFHPLGLALEVIIDEEDGSMHLGGIWDSRDDPEGILFDEFDSEKGSAIAAERATRREARAKLVCCNKSGIQVLPFHE